LKAVTETGGIIGITSIARFICKEGSKEGATIDHFLYQIDYLANIVVSDYVGIGFDISEGIKKEDFHGVYNQAYNAKKYMKYWELANHLR